MSKITALFLDVGGVFLTNGWDHHMRERAAQVFKLDYTEMNNRHALTFDTYEIGKISLDEYLNRVVFYEPRSFTHEVFKTFMFEQSQSFPEMIKLFQEIKQAYGLKVIVVSNEGRELMVNRIKVFKLKSFVDFFVCSGFVQLRKPDEAIYRLAFDIAQVEPDEVVYVDDRAMLTEIGKKLGMHAIRHIDFNQTRAQMVQFFPKITV